MVKQVGIAKKFGLNLIWLPFIYKKWDLNFFHKIFDIQLGKFAIQNLTLPFKSENFMASKYRHVGCQSRGWNVGMLALCAQILIWVSVCGEKAPNVP